MILFRLQVMRRIIVSSVKNLESFSFAIVLDVSRCITKNVWVSSNFQLENGLVLDTNVLSAQMVLQLICSV
jgi:hypothetical protein